MAESVHNKSPLADRIIGVHFEKPANEEDFLRRIPTFADRVKHAFPVAETQAEWKVAFEPNEFGIPVVSEEKSRLLKIFRWWEKDSSPRLGLIVRPNYFGVHYSRSAPGELVDFDRTFDRLERVFSDFAQIFDKRLFTGCSIEYINRIDELFTPQFVRDNVLNLGAALRIFEVLPRPEFVTMSPPFSFAINVIYDQTVPYRVRVHLVGEANKEGTGGDFEIRIRGNSVQAKKKIEWEQATEEIRKLHDCIHKQFHWTFTDAALASFGFK